MKLNKPGEALRTIAGVAVLIALVWLLIRFGPLLDRLEHRLNALIALFFVLGLPFVAVGSWVESRKKKKEKALEEENHKAWMARMADRAKE